MSTKNKLNKNDHTTKKNIPSVIPTNQKEVKKIVNKVVDDHKNSPKPQMLYKQIKKRICEVWACRWIRNDDDDIIRQVKLIPIEITLDKNMTQREIENLVNARKHNIVRSGWLLSEEDARDEALFQIERDITYMSVACDYGDWCEHRAAMEAMILGCGMRHIRQWMDQVSCIRLDHQMSYISLPVIPDLSKYEITVNRCIVPKKESEHHE